jgi:hypothetical protein
MTNFQYADTTTKWPVSSMPIKQPNGQLPVCRYNNQMASFQYADTTTKWPVTRTTLKRIQNASNNYPQIYSMKNNETQK